MTGILGDAPVSDWATDLDQLAFKGSRLIEEVCFFHKQSYTLILDDLIQVHSMVRGKPLRNVLFKAEGVVAPHGGVALDIRLSFTNRDLARTSLAKLLSWHFDRLIIAHGPCVEKDAKPFVERAFHWLQERVCAPVVSAQARRQRDGLTKLKTFGPACGADCLPDVEDSCRNTRFGSLSPTPLPSYVPRQVCG